MPDLSIDRRKMWRHLIQCALAEQSARQQCEAAPGELADRRLLAEGVRLDAAIDALDDDLTDHRVSA